VAGLVKAPALKEWKKQTRFKKNPKTLDLGGFPERGIENVTAFVIMSELTLNGKVRERLQGVTFRIELEKGDDRSADLEPITETKIDAWNKPNSQQVYKRRQRLIYILKEEFDDLAQNPNLRLIHSVVSLARHQSNLGSYVLPRTQVDPLIVFSARQPELTGEFKMHLRSQFLSALSGEPEITVMTGYHNGSAMNPNRR